ncbi:phosphoribosylanthranilate isomerase [Nonomuraea sp. NPDC049152]|uniref:phosphoribosylanthranilate isomerase n=1 Tax=Nonomuraea sp. NPDC049152 TaxID=3154350 RepID=UPI0033DDE464
MIEGVRLDCVQLHGDEGPEFAEKLPVRVIKSIRVGSREDLAGLERYHVDAFLLDAKVDGHFGGTGRRFDWSLLEGVELARPLILAGGLDSENVADAVKQTRPYAVDVCSGVESAVGVKSRQKVRAFVENARRAASLG